MKNKFILSLIFGILVLSVLSTGFVSAGLFNKFTITGNAVIIGSNGWTSWYDRDNPGGSGDWETRSSFDLTGCENPTAIECQTVDGRSINETGQNVICNLQTGLVCLNKENGGSSFFGTTCLDYRVRFYCGSTSSEENSSCDDQGKCIVSFGEGSSNTNIVTYENYTIELVSGTDTSGTFNVNGEQKEITEGSRKTFSNGLNIFLQNIDESFALNTITATFWLNTSTVQQPTCGNGIQEIGEQCDGQNWAVSVTCAKLLGESYTGTLSCTSSCTFDTSNCVATSTNQTTEVTYEGVLKMLKNNCHITSFSNMAGQNIGRTCEEVCNSNAELCISGSFEEYRTESNQRYTAYSGDLISCEYPMYNSSFGGTTTYSCMCCSTP